ncbi:MAG: hypothetical protein ACQESG_05145 [Nanobdellota archaeon]
MGFRRAVFAAGVTMLSLIASYASADTRFQMQDPYVLSQQDLSDKRIEKLIDPWSQNATSIELYTQGGNGHLRFTKDETTNEVTLPDETSDRLIAYLMLKTDYQNRQPTRTWSNSGSAGYAVGKGPQVQLRHSVHGDRTYMADVQAGTKSQALSLTIDEGTRTKLAVEQGEDIDDNAFTRMAVSKMYDDEFVSAGARHDELDASYARAGDSMGFLIDYDGEPGILGAVALGRDRQYLLQELASYDRLNASGNHPRHGDLTAMLKGGISGGEPMAEVTGFFGYVTLFAGIGTYWHDEDPHIGATLNLGQRLPEISVSFSRENQFLDIGLPRYTLDDRLDDFQ